MADKMNNDSNGISAQTNNNDILQLLKTSYGEDFSSVQHNINTDVDTDTKEISREELQNELKKRFLFDSNIEIANNDEEDDYALDADFLQELNGNREKHKKDESDNENLQKEIQIESEIEEISENSEETDSPPWEETEGGVKDTTDIIEIFDDSIALEEPEVVLLSEVSEFLDETLIENDEESEEIDELDEIILLQSIDNESTALEESELEEDEVLISNEPEMKILDLDELSDNTNDSVTIEEEIVKIHEDEQKELLFASEQKEKEPIPEFDHSVIEVLLQLGCKEELEETIGEEGIEEYYATRDAEPLATDNSYAYDGNEYVNIEQTDSILNRYKSSFNRSITNVLLTGALAFIVLLYDIFPLFEIEFFWIFDYTKNPIVYLLFGLQLLFVSSIFSIKKLLKGFKNIIFLHPDGYSVAAVSVVAVAIYDISLFFTKFDELPITFHFLGSMSVLCAVIADHLSLCREKKIFSVYSNYSSSGNSYTLLRDDKDGTIANKMYRGGMDTSQKVRVPSTVGFPTRYFHAVHENRKISNVILCGFFTPTLILSVLAGVICMMLNIDVSSSLSAMWIIFLFSMPVAYLLCDEFLLYIAARKLYKRGCAIASREAIDKYGDTDVIVFGDTHLFAACDPDKIGVVFYDQKNALKILDALNTFYTKIGGPMSNVFNNVSQKTQYNDVTILRSFKNGVEAIIDQKHLLIVGDVAFMQRYGLDFDDKANKNTSRSILCVSFDGKKSAKINVQYKIEPLFEVLIERMAENGIYCAIETYDPLINGTLVKKLRTLGKTPISIVHKTAKDIYRESKQRDNRKEETGLLVRASRLKLAEALIWCKRLISIRKSVAVISIIGGAIAFAAAFALNLMDSMQWTNQYLLLIYKALCIATILITGILKMPRKNYFSRSAIAKKEKAERNNHE